MEKEKLSEELTGEVAGGAKAKNEGSWRKEKTVKCAKCGKEFKYYSDSFGLMMIISKEFFERKAEKRTCPHCGYVNSRKEIGI